jgi:hypothetical protein
MQIFAYTECLDFHSLLEVECKEITGARPAIHTSVDDLRNMIEIFPMVDALIIDLPDVVSKIEELKEFLVKNSKRIKRTLVRGNEHGSIGNIKFFTRMEIQELFDELKLLCTPEDLAHTGWTAIPLCTLIHFWSLPFDLFIRLSDKRFVKRLNAHEEIEQAFVQSLAVKGFTELFCDKKYSRDFSMMLINNMINKIDRSYDSFMDKLKAQDEVFGTTKEIIQHLGLSGRIVEVCESSIEAMCMDILKGPNQFAAYLLALKKDHHLAFHFKHVNLTNYIGTQLIIEMGLPNATEQVKKFIFASYFCDMTIKNPAFHYFRKAQDMFALSLEDQNEVNFHALKASELVTHYKDIPKEVGLIIRQHHGSFSGIGFPAEKSNQLLPLSKVLIVSQDLAFTILTNTDTPVLESLKSFLKKHKSSALNDLIETLEGSFRSKTNQSA